MKITIQDDEGILMINSEVKIKISGVKQKLVLVNSEWWYDSIQEGIPGYINHPKIKLEFETKTKHREI